MLICFLGECSLYRKLIVPKEGEEMQSHSGFLASTEPRESLRLTSPSRPLPVLGTPF
jgi:hypothetical protein